MLTVDRSFLFWGWLCLQFEILLCENAFGVGSKKVGIDEIVFGLFITPFGKFYVYLQLFIFEFE